MARRIAAAAAVVVVLVILALIAFVNASPGQPEPQPDNSRLMFEVLERAWPLTWASDATPTPESVEGGTSCWTVLAFSDIMGLQNVAIRCESKDGLIEWEWQPTN